MRNARLAVVVIAVLFGLSLTLARQAAAQVSPEVIGKAKHATALVGYGGRGIGAAFCVDAAGFFVTHASVAELALDGKVSLVIDAGEANQQTLSAVVMAVDKERELAVLQAQDAAKASLVALGRADDVNLVETTPLTAFGYAVGGPAGTAGDAASVTVSTGRVTSLRKTRGELQRIQLDAAANPGGAGGPVLDAAGRVVGVLAPSTGGATSAIPATRLNAMLETPLVIFTPPAIPPAERGKPQEFTARLISLAKAKAPYVVQLSLKQGNGEARAFTAQSADGETFKVKATPAVGAGGPKRVRVTATYAAGGVVGTVVDRPVKVDGRTANLGSLRRIQPSTRPVIASATRPTSQGATSGLDAVDVDLGGATVRLDLTRAALIEVEDVPEIVEPVAYTLSVLKGGTVVSRRTGMLDVGATANGAATAGSGKRTAAAAAAAARTTAAEPPAVEVKLPATIDDVALGGGGRYLLAYMKKVGKIALIDLPAAKVLQYLSVPDTDILFAAGQDKLVVLLTDQRVIQRYALPSLEREVTVKFPFDGVPKAIAMGCASQGPILVNWARGTDALAASPWNLLDLNTLAATVARIQAHNTSYRDFVHVRASADGKTFGMWCTSHSPSGVETLLLRGREAQSRYEHTSAGHVVPGPDGKHVFTGSGVYTDVLRKLQAGPERSPEANFSCVPALHPGYYLRIPPGGQRYGYDESGERGRPMTGSIYLLGNDRPLVSLPEMPEMRGAANEAWARNDFTLDKRYLFLPASNLLATIPYTNDKVVLRTFDVVKAMDEAGIDYLFVASAPPLTAAKGSAYAYTIKAQSKRGGVTCKLESGPPGMTCSPDGTVAWAVPAGNADEDVAVIITVRDATGQEIFHTFNITVR